MDIYIILGAIALYVIGGFSKEAIFNIDKKGSRLVAMPFLICLCLALKHHEILYLALIVPFQTLRIGYGVPDKKDEGSFLGKIFLNPAITRSVWAGIVGFSVTISAKIFHLSTIWHCILFTLICAGVGLGAGFLDDKYNALTTLKISDKVSLALVDFLMGLTFGGLIWII